VASLPTDERGATAAFVAVSMLMVLGMVALAVDLGMLLERRTESQRAADAGALAGAASFISEPNNADRPRQWAIEYAAKNSVNKAAAVVLTEDVDVLLDEKKVRVRVRNIAERNNAIPTIFARVLGWNEMNVGTVAAAQAFPVAYGYCPIPLGFPDQWDDENGDNLFDPGEFYKPFDPGDPPEIAPSTDHTGYDYQDADYGTQIEIKTRGGPAGGGSGDSICTAHESWRCWFQPYAVNDNDPVGGGVDTLRPWIRHCPDPDLLIKPGDELYAASGSGNKQSLIHTDGTDPESYDFGDLVEEFPGVWAPDPSDPTGVRHCPVVEEVDQDGIATQVCAGPGNMRVRSMPVVQPSDTYGTGANHYAIVDKVICVWIDKVTNDPNAPSSTVSGPAGRRSLYVRIYDGCAGEGVAGGEFLWDLRLVE
jgi:Flp pilus assembly protein TadG